ncbi:EAL domain-containing protein [Sphingomonas piscis]|uniref:EAL domain-containing protein n=1 Tax=Sphingomonas piscis TaxID=2714943 RepID=A0A6G7YNS2_9SPHN|nr:EAL domain-containing protein [Sphingomonas piscis]QIK78393.1 EAL domain-containing protein [Sphingomonas piscis]
MSRLRGRHTPGTVGLASSQAITTCATLVATAMFVAVAGDVLPAAWSSSQSSTLSIALLLNVAIILFGYSRSKDLKKALNAQQEAQALAHRTAYTDHTTGLANRRALMDELVKASSLGRTHSLLLLDLDYFKKVNDLHGHMAGDELLRMVANVLRATTPEGSCCARLGGDEFAVLVPSELSDADANLVAEFITGEIAQPLTISANILQVSASIGIVTFDKSMSAEDALRRADIAMYAAKRAGRNCYARFDTAMETQLQSRTALENEIRSGIERGEFLPYFQPQIDLQSSELIGFEVLARWHSEKRGVLEPAGFLEIAEACGLIGALSMNVMRSALEQARDWPGHLKIAVNISPIQFRDRHLSERILKLLTETGFPAARLELEITETAILEDRELALATVQSLKNVGISISLDDFGTGYASLSQLQALPFDRIKIDRSFVGTLLSNDQSEAIVSTIAGLAKALHLPLTAEGVETHATMERLRHLGCSDAQGWLFGKAMPAADVCRRLGLAAGPRDGVGAEAETVSRERRDHFRRSSAERRCA